MKADFPFAVRLILGLVLCGCLTFPLRGQSTEDPSGASDQPTGQTTSQPADQTATETAADNEAEAVFAPFADRIRVGSRGAQVVITWQDSVDVTNGYSIYRHTALPSLENYQGAIKIGEIGQGVQSFTATIPDETPYYYFLLAKTDNGTLYEIFIPLRNVTLMPVQVVVEISEATAVSAQPQITSLQAELAQDAVRLNLTSSGASGRVVLYRSTDQIESAVDLLNTVVIAILDASETRFLDYPIPGIAYYYAAIPESQLKSGTITFKAGQNTTNQPISIQAGLYRIGLPEANPVSRSMPLPFLVLNRGVSQDIALAGPGQTELRSVSPPTEKVISELLARLGPAAAPVRPELLYPGDLAQASRSAGEDYLLHQIISGDFQSGNYDSAVRNLTLFLSLPRSETNATLARFYRGQAYVMLGLWREAFFEFLQTQQGYYLESSGWIDYLLTILQSL
ncbi:MAG: hypothetical protein A2087_00945 [Spirochaetes bacterium GWD1_61_31]|nr:MAG: hypothetical protein A2Y37_03370 [Spirochaetes bacterium GWB1_60_80]OHD29646.1 MAG: hypothetical protein A2004_01910 [Spirochaetes bacterium GWC1_61_12]OHD37552.1 MAG: hypothetical protein A2087_00945 [Spirochaetes bacterium GWD1_61_31]OHD41939.1 MAG: hypothetical protein A2Y35_14315 [Spirochaetes bacterium GWE1_60_18]OHD61795.1 MAG: hypothetical protein A2Y32_13630 [Spirochaetes bacterium GWF1_60_12]